MRLREFAIIVWMLGKLVSTAPQGYLVSTAPQGYGLMGAVMQAFDAGVNAYDRSFGAPSQVNSQTDPYAPYTASSPRSSQTQYSASGPPAAPAPALPPALAHATPQQIQQINTLIHGIIAAINRILVAYGFSNLVTPIPAPKPPPPLPPPRPAPSPPRKPPPSPPPTGSAAADLHNSYRRKHGARDFKESSTITSRAQSYAQRCIFEHERDGRYGENLYMSSARENPSSALRNAIRAWYNEARQYSYGSGGFSMATGHFTQVVWASTREVGCGVSHCNFGTIVVCKYYPPGNMLGAFQRNVFPPKY